jgi:IPT/TIG domain-containing protein
MRRISIICITLAAAALLVVPPVAGAAKGPKPTINRVTPMRVSVGNLLTIRGAHFKAQRGKNTVIFRNSAGRTAFAKPRRASSSKLVVRVPGSVARLLAVKSSKQRPTRLKLRVLSGQFSKFTPRRLSPVVTGLGDGDGGGGGGGGGGGSVCSDDNDLLANSLEQSIGTDPCLADTDKDGMSDGWEYWSAKDLNIKAVPYPGKRPFPNALDPSDGAGPGATSSSYDFDGDGLSTLEEYRAWRITGSDFDASRVSMGLQSTLGYSDGTKFSRDNEVPATPAWRSADFGLTNPTQPFPATYDLQQDGATYQDDERDADADGLANWLESAEGPGHASWWTGFWAQEAIAVKAWKDQGYCGQRPGAYEERPFQDLDLADPDVDGDQLLDGEDDQDNDDVSNIVELYETQYDLDGNGAGGDNPMWCGMGPGLIPSVDRGGEAWAVNAFNPCAPAPDSRSCPSRIPFE